MAAYMRILKYKNSQSFRRLNTDNEYLNNLLTITAKYAKYRVYYMLTSVYSVLMGIKCALKYILDII